MPSETKKRKRQSFSTTSLKASNKVTSPSFDESINTFYSTRLLLPLLHYSRINGYEPLAVATSSHLFFFLQSDVHAFLRQFPDVQLALNLNITQATSHLLVDDNENRLHCTITKKIVQAAVRRQVIILSTRWLNECMRSNALVDEHPYEIISDSHTTLRLSEQNLSPANQLIFPPTYPYLYAFAIECRQCQGSINRTELIELIQLTGAQLFQADQAVDVLIVLCDTNDKNLMKIKEKYVHAPASTIKYVTSDFLLKSIIKFEVQDVEKYAL